MCVRDRSRVKECLGLLEPTLFAEPNVRLCMSMTVYVVDNVVAIAVAAAVVVIVVVVVVR